MHDSKQYCKSLSRLELGSLSVFTMQLMAIHLVSRRDLQCCCAQVIQDIDQQGSWHTGDVSQALSEAVTKVASIARELYLPCKDCFEGSNQK